jgi:hypothetical protein
MFLAYKWLVGGFTAAVPSASIRVKNCNAAQ